MNLPKITPMPPAPNNNDIRSIFISKAYALWDWIGKNTPNFNALGLFINEKSEEVKENTEKAINAKNTALTAKDSAVAAWENIQDYVILSEATYSKDEFDELYELLINQTTENRALISVYHEQTN